MRGVATMRIAVASSLLLLALPVGCVGGPDPEPADPASLPDTAELEQPFTSDVATLMDFEFDGELTSNSGVNLKNQVRSQLMFTVGHLNGERSVARLDKLVLTNTTVASIGSGLYRVRYHAKLPVAWGSKTNLPTAYSFTLPKRVDWSGQSTFTTKYGATCNDGDDASVTINNYWYHYRPRATGCSMAPADVSTMNAVVTVNATNTVAKYPEYHKLWEDGALNTVAIFGKYAAGATSQSDAGIAAYNEFIDALLTKYPDALSTPSVLPDYAIGPSVTDVTFKFDRSGGRVTVTVLLVDAVTAVTATWDKRYAELTAGADLILYNGHAGLGANIASLSRKGKFFPGAYQIFFMNGCDTFAYYDNTLPSIRAALNPSDPTGTRFMDFITNAMPAYFHALTEDSMALINAAVAHTTPTTYQNIFKNMDRVQVVVVTGEEDNVFSSTYDDGVTWNGLEAEGAVGKSQTVSYVTETLPAGKYVFTTTPDPAAPGGDADLRVRVGAAPTITSTYKCPSYQYNSNEKCSITLTAPAKVYLAVTGDKLGVNSRYYLRGFQLPR
ncbi:MAG TPA: hypothetical protein VF065_16425 [Ilumatobacter sp.]